uniref:Uncharacterized protein n=1 Tax=Alexandrium catenella TaxID=2925 RepID=A0A7S1WE90_ALECA
MCREIVSYTTVAWPSSLAVKALPARLSPSSSSCSSASKLTRGARRRQVQRLRKKLGACEFDRALPAGPFEAWPSVSETAPAGDEVPVPTLLIDELELPSMSLSSHELELPSGPLEKTVPVCAIQEGAKIEESFEVEFRDAFVVAAVPCETTQDAGAEVAADIRIHYSE